MGIKDAFKKLKPQEQSCCSVKIEDKTDNVILLENKLTAAKLKRDKEELKQKGKEKVQERKNGRRF